MNIRNRKSYFQKNIRLSGQRNLVDFWIKYIRYKRFLRSLITNPLLDSQNSKWRIQYGGPLDENFRNLGYKKYSYILHKI